MTQQNLRPPLGSVERLAMQRKDAQPVSTVEGCGWVDCQQGGSHEHESQFEWVNPSDPTAGRVVVLVKDDGTVTISEAALAQLLTDAGWERAR
jgi:predicted RNA binding protein YcfA (HicA-like mRNA interferase family)